MGLTAGDIEKILDTKLTAFKEDMLKDLRRSIERCVQDSIRSEVASFENTIGVMNERLKSLEEKNHYLEASLDRIEQSSRNLNIRIFGIQQKGEKEDLQGILLDIFSQAKCGIKAGDIKVCYRVIAKNRSDLDNKRLTRSHSGGAATGNDKANKPPAILVRFCSDAARKSVFAKRKQLASMAVHIREDLTRFRLSLLTKAIERVGAKSAWCLYGNVYVKAGDCVHRIADFDALENVLANRVKTMRKQR